MADNNEVAIVPGDPSDNESGFWVESSKGDKYFIDGVKYALRSNGAIQDLITSKFVAVTSKALTFQNRESAREASLKRWADYREAAAAGLAASGDLSGSPGGAGGAWEAIVKKQADLAKDTSQGVASTVAAKFVGNAVGALDARGKAISSDQSGDLAGFLRGLGADKLQVIIGISAKLDDN